jgi:hypothetical protein
VDVPRDCFEEEPIVKSIRDVEATLLSVLKMTPSAD